MLVEDLIAELQKYDPKALVIRAGYEGGVAEISTINSTKIALNVNTAWYYGEHETVDYMSYRDLSSFTQVDAVYVG